MHAVSDAGGGVSLAAPPAAGDWRPALWQVWLGVSALLVLIGLPRMLAFSAQDPDDYMRLLEVRDWLAGQGWFDVRQYRMDPPLGADMHWSRLVDLPVAAFLLPFGQVLPAHAAQVAAMTAVPLVQLLVAMLVMRGLLRALGAPRDAVLAAIAVLPLFPLLASNFMPLRIDHHGWQAVAALAAAWLLVRGGRRAAFAAGALAAAWLTISLEGLPLVALLGGLFALRYWLSGKREHEAFLAAAALSGALLFAATRPAGEFATAYCDMLSWPHFLALAAAALLAAGSRVLPAQARPLGRLAALVPLPLAAGAALLAPLGACAVNPFAGLDPVLRRHWLDNIAEGLPITAQPPSVAAMLLWTMLIVALGARLALRQAADEPARERWTMLALYALGAGAMSLLVMRAGLAAQILAVPFAAVLLAHYVPRARALRGAAPRIAATLACIVLATPTFASAAFKPLDRLGSSGAGASAAGAAGEPCDLARLGALPRARLFAPLDLGPEILARTPHSVVMGNYHRNQAKMHEVFDAFAGPPGRARDIVAANRSGYLVACVDPQALSVYAEAGRGNLADKLLAGDLPDWLEPVAGFERGTLRVYRVR